MSSPWLAAARAVSSLIGNSASATPMARKPWRGPPPPGANARAHRRRRTVMREHPHVGGARRRGEPRHGSWHFTGAGEHTLDEAIEFLARQAGALPHAVCVAGLGPVPNRAVHVVVEGEEVDAAIAEPLADLGFGVEIIGLVAQVKAGV